LDDNEGVKVESERTRSDQSHTEQQPVQQRKRHGRACGICHAVSPSEAKPVAGPGAGVVCEKGECGEPENGGQCFECAGGVSLSVGGVVEGRAWLTCDPRNGRHVASCEERDGSGIRISLIFKYCVFLERRPYIEEEQDSPCESKVGHSCISVNPSFQPIISLTYHSHSTASMLISWNSRCGKGRGLT